MIMPQRAALLLLLPALAKAQQVCTADSNGDGMVGVDGA